MQNEYSGDHDLVFPYVGTQNWIHGMELPMTKPWAPWFVNKQVAGYVLYVLNIYI